MDKTSKFTRVTEKGQCTIPYKIREYLKIKQGDYISYKINKEGKVVLEKLKILLEEELKSNNSK